MSEGTVSERIRQFFGGNFHQDWHLVAEEWEGVVDGYANGKDPARLTALADEIDDLRNGEDDDALAAWFNKVPPDNEIPECGRGQLTRRGSTVPNSRQSSPLPVLRFRWTAPIPLQT